MGSTDVMQYHQTQYSHQASSSTVSSAGITSVVVRSHAQCPRDEAGERRLHESDELVVTGGGRRRLMSVEEQLESDYDTASADVDQLDKDIIISLDLLRELSLDRAPQVSSSASTASSHKVVHLSFSGASDTSPFRTSFSRKLGELGGGGGGLNRRRKSHEAASRRSNSAPLSSSGANGHLPPVLHLHALDGGGQTGPTAASTGLHRALASSSTISGRHKYWQRHSSTPTSATAAAERVAPAADPPPPPPCLGSIGAEVQRRCARQRPAAAAAGGSALPVLRAQSCRLHDKAHCPEVRDPARTAPGGRLCHVTAHETKMKKAPQSHKLVIALPQDTPDTDSRVVSPHRHGVRFKVPHNTPRMAYSVNTHTSGPIETTGQPYHSRGQFISQSGQSYQSPKHPSGTSYPIQTRAFNGPFSGQSYTIHNGTTKAGSDNHNARVYKTSTQSVDNHAGNSRGKAPKDVTSDDRATAYAHGEGPCRRPSPPGAGVRPAPIRPYIVTWLDAGAGPLNRLPGQQQ